MTTQPKLFVLTGAIAALVGMAWGIQMSIEQEYLLSPAHAHLNLIGFVIMTLFGLYYAITPDAKNSKIAKYHYPLTLLAVVTMVPGIVMALQETGTTLAKIGSVLALVSMGMFAAVVAKHGVGTD